MGAETTNERVRKGRATQRNKTLKRLAGLLAVLLSLWGGYNLVRQPWVSFGVIYITGAEKLSREEVLFLTGLKEPVNLFLVSKATVKELLTNDLRIKNASVQYELPNILHIDIEEKEPFLYIANNYGYAILDSDGLIINAAKNVKDAVAPIVSGLKAGNEFVGDQVKGDDILQILAFLELVGKNGRALIAEINVSADLKVKLFDLAGRWYILGEIGDLRDKAKGFAAISKEIFEKNLSVEFVDLSYSKPYIKIKRQEMNKKSETRHR